MSGRPPKEPVRIPGWPEPIWWCSCCGEPLPESRFGEDKRSSNGLKSWCLRCVREDRRMRRAISGEAAREWNKHWDNPGPPDNQHSRSLPGRNTGLDYPSTRVDENNPTTPVGEK